jgi:hypothetical protein
MKPVTVVFAVLAFASASASQPGQPLDCSDWVFLMPGYSCSVVIARGHCDPAYPGGANYVCQNSVGETSAMDNESDLLTFEIGPRGICPGGLMAIDNNFQLVRYVGSTRQVIAYIESRCVTSRREDDVSASTAFTFDAARGRVLISIATYCYGYDASDCPADYDGDGSPDSTYAGDVHNLQIIAISGFATLFDVLQSYTPPPSQLSFRVPYMPEGFGGADHFDTYWGPLTKPIDFTQAHPLQCGYPATPPRVGDYESVTDTLPTPAPDSGYYYVTAATYQGQTRYGRKTTNGHLSGRDPALLPACVAP